MKLQGVGIGWVCDKFVGNEKSPFGKGGLKGDF